MAFPLDPYGNPIPINPGAKVITTSDGVPKPIRNNLLLTDDFTVTDVPGSDTTLLGVSGSPATAITELTGDVTATGPGSVAATIANDAVTTAKIDDAAVTTIKIADANVTSAKLTNTGSTAGRVGVPVLIGQADLSGAASFAPTAWAAGAYRKLQFFIRIDSGTLTGANIVLTGLTAGTAYVTSSVYGLGTASAAETEVAGASWNTGIISARAKLDGHFNIKVGGFRDGTADLWIANGGTPVHYIKHFHNTDTTNEATAFVLTFTGGTATGYAELWGTP